MQHPKKTGSTLCNTVYIQMYKTNQEQEGPGAPGAPKIGGGKNLMVHYKNVLTKLKFN